MQPFAAQCSLFRAYDIRGARQQFTNSFIQGLGQAFAQLYQAQQCHIKDSFNTVVIGYDARFGSDAIAHTLAEILCQHDLMVINLGLISTPMMAFWAQRYDGHGIMVTASHSSKEILGVKWLVNNVSPSSADIQTLYQRLSVTEVIAATDNLAATINAASLSADNNADNSLNLPAATVVTTYIDAIVQVLTRIHQLNDGSATKQLSLPKLNLTVVIDCMHGATSHIAQPLFSRFCQQVIMLNDMPDGNFPTGNPDPTEPERLAQLQQTVMASQADMGLAFDGDGDRLMIVDNSGMVVTPDHLLYLLAQVAITECPSLLSNTTKPQVLFDVKCSHHLSQLLASLGATPTMIRTGSSIMRRQLQFDNCQAIFAGELSGHFIFNDGYFMAYDDAMYAGLRLLHWLAGPNSIANNSAGTTINNQSVIATTLGSETKVISTPAQLTDIIRRLPKLISTADHYLPWTENISTDCTIIDHLADFCRYLQHLLDERVKPLNRVLSCDCAIAQHDITLAQAQQLLPSGTQLTCIDGVRLDFAHGFGVLRKSNTSQSLTVRFAGDSVADLKEAQARFVALCHAFDNDLANQIAMIYP